MAGVAVRPEYQAPADPEEFYRQDYAYITGLVRRHLGSRVAQDVEDVAGDIMEKLLAENAIGQYDPGHVSDYTKKPVTWRSFLSHKVLLRLRGKREQVFRHYSREPAICDAPVGTAATWVELHGGSRWDDYPVLDDSEYLVRMREYLALQKEAWQGGCTLLALFDLLVEKLKDGENVSRKDVQARFGVSASTATARLKFLRSTLSSTDATVAPLLAFEVGGLTLTAAEVRSAIDVLRAAPGNRVRPAFASISHPLAVFTTKQYIALGRAEVREYPECKVATGTRTSGHSSQTKIAIIHRLERLLAGAATPSVQVPQPVLPPEPEPEVAPREKLEAALWHMGLAAGQVDKICAVAEHVYAELAV